ncbi:hypothetical protein LUX73_27770 [Actinomadura madurae]|nr:hypothetical protein [Actinomadura madurae]MCQ0008118.1 hypothetical protein [Actinomadura madurae]
MPRSGRATCGQKGLWLDIAAKDHRTAFFNPSKEVEVPAGLSVGDLLGGLRTLVVRHQSLRTVLYRDGDGALTQEVRADGAIDVPLVEIGDDAEALWDAVAATGGTWSGSRSIWPPTCRCVRRSSCPAGSRWRCCCAPRTPRRTAPGSAISPPTTAGCWRRAPAATAPCPRRGSRWSRRGTSAPRGDGGGCPRRCATGGPCWRPRRAPCSPRSRTGRPGTTRGRCTRARPGRR